MPSSKLVKEPGRRLTLLAFLRSRGQQKIATGRDYLAMTISLRASKLAVTSLALLLSEVSK